MNKSNKSIVRELKIIVLVFWVILTVFYVVRVVIVTRYVGLNRALADLQVQATKLTMDNRLLENEIARQSSLKVLEQKAKESGFIEPEKIMYIK
jgi:cell division protein FtsL